MRSRKDPLTLHTLLVLYERVQHIPSAWPGNILHDFGLRRPNACSFDEDSRPIFLSLPKGASQTRSVIFLIGLEQPGRNTLPNTFSCLCRLDCVISDSVTISHAIWFMLLKEGDRRSLLVVVERERERRERERERGEREREREERQTDRQTGQTDRQTDRQTETERDRERDRDRDKRDRDRDRQRQTERDRERQRQRETRRQRRLSVTPGHRTVQEGLSMVSCREGITKSKHVRYIYK